MSEFLTKAQVDEFKEIFNLFDTESKGVITIRQLGTINRCFGINPTEPDLQDTINEVDLDGNGELDFDEFLSLMCRKGKDTDIEQELIQAFGHIDGNENGKISKNELYAFMSKDQAITEEEVSEMVREADVDADGYIDFEEFKRVMMAR